jgi:hypothetical protein
MVVHRAKVVALLAAVLLVGGCAAQDPAAPGGPTTAPSDVASPTPPSSPTATRTPDPRPTYRPSPRPKGTITLPGEPSKPAAGAMELTGTVTAGVEGGSCLLLDGYLLINPNPRVVREGATIRVTGRVRMDMMTTCQQGTPFEIETAEPA